MPSTLGIAILRQLKAGKTLPEISEITRTDPKIVGIEVARLQVEGLLSDEGELTERGHEALEG